jgi:hypothetical protein
MTDSNPALPDYLGRVYIIRSRSIPTHILKTGYYRVLPHFITTAESERRCNTPASDNRINMTLILRITSDTNTLLIILISSSEQSRSQRLRGLRHELSLLARSLDVCLRLFCVCVALCVGSGLAKADPPSKESYRLCMD